MNTNPDPKTPADAVPDVSNAPVALGAPRPRKIPILLPVTGAIAAAGAIFYVLIGGSTQHCRGATRSAKLKWDERQSEVDQAIAREKSASSAPVKGG